MLATKGMRFPIDVILVCILWYAAYPLSYRHLEEMMQERGVFVDHSSISHWAIRFLPLLEKVFRKHTRKVAALLLLLLLLFTVITAAVCHTAFGDQNELMHFLKSLAVAGGLLQVVVLGAGRWGLDLPSTTTGLL